MIQPSFEEKKDKAIPFLKQKVEDTLRPSFRIILHFKLQYIVAPFVKIFESSCLFLVPLYEALPFLFLFKSDPRVVCEETGDEDCDVAAFE